MCDVIVNRSREHQRSQAFKRAAADVSVTIHKAASQRTLHGRNDHVPESTGYYNDNRHDECLPASERSHPVERVANQNRDEAADQQPLDRLVRIIAQEKASVTS